MSATKENTSEGSILFRDPAVKRIGILMLVIMLTSTLVSFAVDIFSYSLTEGWYWGFSHFFHHGVEVDSTGIQLPYFGVLAISWISSLGQITEKLISIGLLFVNFALLLYSLRLISNSVFFSAILSSLFFSLHVLGQTYIFGDYHLFFICGLLLLLLGISVSLSAIPICFWTATAGVIQTELFYGVPANFSDLSVRK